MKASRHAMEFALRYLWSENEDRVRFGSKVLALMEYHHDLTDLLEEAASILNLTKEKHVRRLLNVVWEIRLGNFNYYTAIMCQWLESGVCDQWMNASEIEQFRDHLRDALFDEWREADPETRRDMQEISHKLYSAVDFPKS